VSVDGQPGGLAGMDEVTWRILSDAILAALIGS
jgi:hypothetical protein